MIAVETVSPHEKPRACDGCGQPRRLMRELRLSAAHGAMRLCYTCTFQLARDLNPPYNPEGRTR